MAGEGKRIYVPRPGWTNAINVYEVTRETPMMLRVKPLTWGAFERQFLKDNRYICHSLEEAREKLASRLLERIEGLEAEIAQVKLELDKVPQVEPQYRDGVLP